MIKNSFFQSVIKFLKTFALEFIVDTKNFWYQSLGCLLIISSIVLSFFYSAFCYVSAVLLVLGIVACFIIKNDRLWAFNFIMCFLPFSMVLTIPGFSTNIFAIAVSVFTACCCVKLLIDFIRKNLKINLIVTITFALIVAYIFILLLIKRISLDFCASIVVGLTLLYVLSYYKKIIDYKAAVLLLVLSMLLSCIIGCFWKHFPNLNNFYNFTNALGTIRFSALFPNTNAFSMNILFCLGALSSLYLTNKIRFLFYPLYITLIAISFTTLSKMVFVVLVVFIPVLLLIRFLKDKKFKIAWKPCCAIILCTIVGAAFQFVNFSLIVKRMEDPIAEFNVERAETHEKPDGLQFVSELSTGRTDLWINCIKAITEDAKCLLFGHSFSESDETLLINIQNSNPHNTYLQCVYHIGLIGLLLLSAFLLALLFTNKTYKSLLISGLPLLFMVVLCFGVLDNFSYVGCLYLVLAYLSLFGKNNDELLVKEDVSKREEEKIADENS